MEFMGLPIRDPIFLSKGMNIFLHCMSHGKRNTDLTDQTEFYGYFLQVTNFRIFLEGFMQYCFNPKNPINPKNPGSDIIVSHAYNFRVRNVRSSHVRHTSAQYRT